MVKPINLWLQDIELEKSDDDNSTFYIKTSSITETGRGGSASFSVTVTA